MNADDATTVLRAKTIELAGHWTAFRTALDEAIQRVPQEYFQVRRYDDDDPEPRERAYCYELYHQLRIKLRPEFPYTLHGEIDKAGHATIVACFGAGSRPNPDFIVHKPSGMAPGDNLVIMEVKASDESVKAVAEDIKKIETFRQCVGYAYGIMLFFGSDQPKPFSAVGGVEYLWHRTLNEKPLVYRNARFT